ncbi:hypothetical protein BW21_1269 [Burkholderia humptydooensis]|nr:hypothetical protein BW21_1269 [Burkholderia sp. 2002721687]EIP88646.1 hypothetical protein A33K_14746 [Burkholderia humptydooensis MSMB43]
MANHTITAFGPALTPWALSQEEAARQAIASLRGYVYQLHSSVAAWMRLPPDGELHLEVAEDYAELLTSPDKAEQILRAVQVKDTRESGSITLNSADVLKAVETLFSLQESNPGRPVFLTFLTTSPIGRELKDPLPSGTPALEVWSIAANGGDVGELHDALRARFTNGKLAEFLNNCSADDLRCRLLARLTFACGEPPWEQLGEDGRDHLVRIRSEVHAEASAARRAYDALFGTLYRAALRPQSRKLDRQEFINAFAEATAYSLPSQVVADLTGNMLRSAAEGAPPARTDAPTVAIGRLRDVARKLRDQGRPPSLLPLFPDAPTSALAALDSLSDVDRWVVSSVTENDKQPARLRLSDLLRHPELHHIVYAAPGAGKSHALFRIATGPLEQTKDSKTSAEDTDSVDSERPGATASSESDGVLPLLLPIGGIKTADEVLSQIRTLLPDVDAAEVLRSRQVCVLLDGWSEFATGENFSQRAALLRTLAGVRVIACARHPDESDTAFKRWSLERLTPGQIREVLESALDGSRALSDDLVDLLRLPLMLSLYLLLGGPTSTQGELIAHFHRHVSKQMPEQFEDALSDAVSLLSLAKERSYNKFLSALRRAATAREITEPQSALKQLGTITARGSVAVAVHDLYWSWLSGAGLLRCSRIEQSLFQLDTRESLSLALQSGELVEPAFVASTANTDAVLAATFDSSLGRASMDTSLAAVLESMFLHPHLAVRCRGAIAGFRSGRASYVSRALDVVSEVSAAQLYVPELVAALDSATLFANKVALGNWLGGPGTQMALEAIATNGDARWLPWLEQMLLSERVEPKLALAAALACGSEIPKWGAQHLQGLVSQSPWHLRFASNRRSNRELALWLAKNYPQAPETAPSGWWHVNRVLISCGDEGVFEELLLRFPSMSKSAQQVLGMTIPELGSAWVAKFQKVAFASAGAQHHHRLAETVSLEIDDGTARDWIARGYYHAGWEVLLARYGAKALPELLAQLPPSFGGQPRVLALEVIASLKDTPASFIDELNSRVFNSVTQQLGISPKVGESVIEAAATVKPLGIAWLVRQCLSNPKIFDGYHARRFLGAYVDWRRETGNSITVGSATAQRPFEDWYVVGRFVHDWDEHNSPEALRLVPHMAVEAVVGPFANDDDKAHKVLARLESLPTYDHALFERMIGSAMLVSLIPKVFADALNLFPPNQLLRFVQSDHVKHDELFHALRTASDPSFLETHFILTKRVISAPLNLDNIRSVANMLRSYARDALLEYFRPLLSQEGFPESDNLHWLLREASIIRGELLIDEHGKLLQ